MTALNQTLLTSYLTGQSLVSMLAVSEITSMMCSKHDQLVGPRWEISSKICVRSIMNTRRAWEVPILASKLPPSTKDCFAMLAARYSAFNLFQCSEYHKNLSLLPYLLWFVLKNSDCISIIIWPTLAPTLYLQLTDKQPLYIEWDPA